MEVIKDKKSYSAFKVIEGDSVILSAKSIKWYKSDLVYEYSDCKCGMRPFLFHSYRNIPRSKKSAYLKE